MDQRTLAAIRRHPQIESTEELERAWTVSLQHRMGANENLFPFPDRLRERLCGAIDKMKLYCDPESHALRERLGAELQLPLESLHISGGIDSLLADTAIAYLEPGDTVLMTEGTYVTMSIVATRQGARVEMVQYDGGRSPVSEMAEIIEETKPRLVYLVNPDNPAGCVYSEEEIGQLLAAASHETLILLDEAYADFIEPEDLLSYSEHLYPNLLRYRTFSKMYGLAGLKIGYVVGTPDRLETLSRISLRYGVGRFAQEAAMICLDEPGLREEVLGAFEDERRRITEGLAQVGIGIRPCTTSFMLADIGNQPRRDAAIKHLSAGGLLTRPTPGRGHESLMRISIGTERESKRLLTLVHQFVSIERTQPFTGAT